MPALPTVARSAAPGRAGGFDFDGGVAVVTGAASGLGRAIATACAARGMRILLADIDEAGLGRVVGELSTRTPCIGHPTDVRAAVALEALAELAFGTFGGVDLLFNNAGVVIARPLLETTTADWRWMLEVNLWGVVNGVAAFLPRMLGQQRESRVVNTASAAGFLSEPDLGAYAASKHAVVALSETLHKELLRDGANMGVTVLSPAYVPTAITASARARPAELAPASAAVSAATQAAEARIHKAVHSGRLTADDVAARVLEAIRARRLHVFTHAKIRPGIEARMEAIYAGFAP